MGFFQRGARYLKEQFVGKGADFNWSEIPIIAEVEGLEPTVPEETPLAAEEDRVEPTVATEADRMQEDDLPPYEVPQAPIMELPDLPLPSEDRVDPTAEENQP